MENVLEGLFEVWLCSDTPANNATFHELWVVLMSFPWLELVLFSKEFLSYALWRENRYPGWISTGCLNRNFPQCFHLQYGIKFLTILVFMRINRITDIQDPAEPLAMISNWQIFIPFLLSQSFMESKFNLPLEKMRIRQRRMKVPRVNGRVIQKVKFNFLWPATSGVHEKSRVHDNITWCYMDKGAGVETGAGFSEGGPEVTDNSTLGCSITWDPLLSFFFSFFYWVIIYIP